MNILHMKTYLKLSIFALFVFPLLFTNCKSGEPDDENENTGSLKLTELSGTISNKTDADAAEVESVVGSVTYEYTFGGVTVELEHTVFTADYADGSFSSALQSPVPDDRLRESSVFEDIGCTVSDKTAKITYFSNLIGSSGTSVKGNVEFVNSKKSNEVGFKKARFIYVNKDIQITGTGVDDGSTLVIDWDLKTGWNLTVEEKTSSHLKLYSVSFYPTDMAWVFTEL